MRDKPDNPERRNAIFHFKTNNSINQTIYNYLHTVVIHLNMVSLQ